MVLYLHKETDRRGTYEEYLGNFIATGYSPHKSFLIMSSIIQEELLIYVVIMCIMKNGFEVVCEGVLKAYLATRFSRRCLLQGILCLISASFWRKF